MLSKYSIAFLAISLPAAVAILPSQRHWLRSRWLYLGALAALLVASSNLLWLVQHGFITIRMEHFIHARDVRNGRASSYYSDQIRFNLFAFPLALAGLVSLLRSSRFRLLAFLYLGPFLLFALVRGRGYYLLSAYPVLFAAEAVALEDTLRRHSTRVRLVARSLVFTAMLADVLVIACSYLPIAPTGSSWWKWQMKTDGDLRDEIGWHELVAEVAAIRDELSPQDRSRLAIFAANYGEAGALALFGPAYGLPTPISGVNSFHARGFGPYAPQTVIALGFSREYLQEHFTDCRLAGRIDNRYGVRNEESQYQFFVCHALRTTWPLFWADRQWFG